jgi:RHS repeat-associated protein
VLGVLPVGERVAEQGIPFGAYDELTTDGTATNTYDGLDRLTASGTSTLTYAGTGRGIVTDGTSTPAGTPLGVKQGAAASMAVTDLHTDLTALLNPATGVVAGSRSYSPFGRPTATAGTQTALGYQGQYTDPGSGNVNMGARWYQPSTGGFASRDTAGLDPRDTATANRYGYAAGNPLTGIDPTGHNPICSILGGTIGGGLGFPGDIFGDLLGQTACPSELYAEPNVYTGPGNCLNNACPWPNIYDEVRQLHGLVKRGGGTGLQPPSGCGKSCGTPGGRKPTGPAGNKHGTAGGQNNYSADAAAAARAAVERARAARVRNDALTPHPKPPSDLTISPKSKP